MHRVHWRLVALLFFCCLLASCSSAGQPIGSVVRQTAATGVVGTPSLPADANPVLAVPAQASNTPVPTPTLTPTPIPTVVAPVVPHPTPPPIANHPPPSWTRVESQLQQQLLQQINQDCATQGLYAYVLNSTLSTGARQHSVTMAGSCGMQHQCPGEPNPAQRISNEGITWTSCGENIGYTSPNPTAWAGVQQIEQIMLNEQPPNDGHRRNLLNTSYHRFGIGIYIDAHGLVWITEDFAS
jgi:uncharacterized protein YkwD